MKFIDSAHHLMTLFYFFKDDDMLLLQIVTETPIWVWILFAFLITTGINALSDRETNIEGLFIMPLFFLLWGGFTVIDNLAFLFWGFASMMSGVIAGSYIGWCHFSDGPQLKRKEGTHLIIWPGTSWALVFVIITFIIMYALNAFLNMEPYLRFSLWFNIIFGVSSGLISGVLWGRTVNLYLTYRKTYLCG